MTIFSPWIVGIVDTLKSISFFDLYKYPPVLRKPAFGDIQIYQYFNAGEKGRLEVFFGLVSRPAAVRRPGIEPLKIPDEAQGEYHWL